MNSISELQERLAHVEKERDDALLEAEYEKNIRKNLQHVIVSQWGVDVISNCIDRIREAEESIGPLGPINDFSLAQILSSTLVLPAELIINDLRKQLSNINNDNESY